MTLADAMKLLIIRPALIANVLAIALIARQSLERHVPLIGRQPARMHANFSKNI